MLDGKMKQLDMMYNITLLHEPRKFIGWLTIFFFLLRGAASLTVRVGKRSTFLIFTQVCIIFFLFFLKRSFIFVLKFLALRMDELPTREGPGYATVSLYITTIIRWVSLSGTHSNKAHELRLSFVRVRRIYSRGNH